MMGPRGRYLGVRPGDLDGKAYASFWNPHMEPLSEAAREAVACGPVASALALPLDGVHRLLAPGDLELENGFALDGVGGAHVAIRTELPGATPEMIDWWFGWHGCEAERYKLWHPRAHVHAAWTTLEPVGAWGRARYVGRVSHVEEYVGSESGRYAIQFRSPRELGLDERMLADAKDATAVCARVGFAEHPIDFGYLIHHVRRVPGGAEMRSRFWIGGAYAAGRGGSVLGAVAAQGAKWVKRAGVQEAQALLVHCAQEMAHLAGFLPRLFGEMKDVA